MLKIKSLRLAAATCLMCLAIACAEDDTETSTPGNYNFLVESTDDLYLGQKPPGMTPEKFAPGIISTEDYYEISCCFSPDGREFYFTRRGGEFGERNTIMVTRLSEGGWSKPGVAEFSGKHFDFEPHITHDGRKLYYGSDRPGSPQTGRGQGGSIWVVHRTQNGWSEPEYHCNGMFASTSQNGNLYVTAGIKGVSFQELKDGKYGELKALEAPFNLPRADFHPWISADENLLIFDSYDRPENIGRADIYFSTRSSDGKWSEPRNAGSEVNTAEWEGCPSFSHDEKYFFFTREGEIYWVSTDIFKVAQAGS